jgi:hypothetical protein
MTGIILPKSYEGDRTWFVRAMVGEELDRFVRVSDPGSSQFLWLYKQKLER